MKIANFDDLLLINFDNVSSVEKLNIEKLDGPTQHRIAIHEVGKPDPRELEFGSEEEMNSSWETIKKLFGA